MVLAATILAGCSGGSTGSPTPSGSATLVITPALGQVYSGQVIVTGSSGTSLTYPIVSGMSSVTADISGLAAPFLISLTGDPAKGNQLEFFDEGSGNIVSALSPPPSSIRAIVPNIDDVPLGGVGVTPLTELAAATVADTATGQINIATLSVSTARAANSYGLNIAQRLSGSTTITNVLTPPTPVMALGANLGTSAPDTYAKLLFTIASLSSATYGANAFQKARTLSDSIVSTTNLPSSFNADILAAASAVSNRGFAGSLLIPTPLNPNGNSYSGTYTVKHTSGPEVLDPGGTWTATISTNGAIATSFRGTGSLLNGTTSYTGQIAADGTFDVFLSPCPGCIGHWTGYVNKYNGVMSGTWFNTPFHASFDLYNLRDGTFTGQIAGLSN